MDNNSEAFDNIPYNKESLKTKYELSVEDVDSILTACGLPIDQYEYSHHDISNSFEPAVQNFKNQETFHPPDHLESKSKPVPPQKSDRSKKTSKSKPISLFELKAIISDLIGSKVSLADTLKVIEANGLEEKQEYTHQECDLIIETISNEDESIDFNATIQGLSTASSEGFAKLVDRVTDRLAESAPDAFNQIYMQKIAANMERNQQQIRDFYHQLEETIIGELEGKKSPLQILIERRSKTNLSSLCSMKSAASLPESNSDSTTS
jgi:hypothetical protein